MIRPEIKTGPGRPPVVRWPIRRVVVEQGQPFEKVMPENTTVRCYRCGEEFLVNRDTAFRIRNSIDEMPYIRCPHCGYVAAVLYYFDRVVRKGDKNVH